MNNANQNRWLNSWAYRKAKGLVSATLATPGKLIDLVANAQAMKALGGDRFSAIAEPTKAAFRMVKAYAKGEYREVSLESIGLVVAAIIYFVMPIDALPDFMLALGFADDAALMAWTLRSVSDDIERFQEWEHHEASIIDAEFEGVETDHHHD